MRILLRSKKKKKAALFFFKKGSHTVERPFSFSRICQLIDRNILAKLEADVRGKQRKGKYEGVQKVFCISYASDVALHSVASPAAFLGFSELNLKLCESCQEYPLLRRAGAYLACSFLFFSFLLEGEIGKTYLRRPCFLGCS